MEKGSDELFLRFVSFFKENSVPKIDMRTYLPKVLSDNLQCGADYLGVPKNGAALLAMHQWTKEFIESKWVETEETLEDGAIAAKLILNGLILMSLRYKNPIFKRPYKSMLRQKKEKRLSEKPKRLFMTR